jgi:guanylate kinase
VLYVLCGVSSAGKTTILNAVLQRDSSLRRMITSTTRPPRPGEVDHLDYHFVSGEHFHAAVQARQLVCPISHRGQWYATALDDLRACQSRDTLVVLRPDKIGELRQLTPASIIGIYITRPGLDQPTTEDDHTSVAHQHRCTYQVTNVPDKPEHAVDQILDIIHAYAGG